MSKEQRLTIRLPADLDAWLAEQAGLNGLDKAAFARMLLFRSMNGQGDLAPAIAPELMADSEPTSQVDIDALVAATLAEAQANGRLHARAIAAPAEEIDPALAELGMRPFVMAPAPHFGDKSPRIQRSSTWAPGGR